MDDKVLKTELQDAIYSEDKEILDVVKQCNNELQPSIDSDEERESINNAVWYCNAEIVESCGEVEVSSRDDYYDSDDWSDYESFNRQVQLECMWNKIEEDTGTSSKEYRDTEDSDQNSITASDDSIEESEYDWERMLGSGYWDTNGGSPQWVPTQFNKLVDIPDFSI